MKKRENGKVAHHQCRESEGWCGMLTVANGSVVVSSASRVLGTGADKMRCDGGTGSWKTVDNAGALVCSVISLYCPQIVVYTDNEQCITSRLHIVISRKSSRVASGSELQRRRRPLLFLWR